MLLQFLQTFVFQFLIDLNTQVQRGVQYVVRMEAGTISFADTSRPLPKAFTQLTVFTKDVSEDVCGIKRDSPRDGSASERTGRGAGTSAGRTEQPLRRGVADGVLATHPRIVTTRPNVAMASAAHCPQPTRAVVATCHTGSSNIA